MTVPLKTTDAVPPANAPLAAFMTLAAEQVAAALTEARTTLDPLTGDVLTLARHVPDEALPGAAEDALREALTRLQAIDRLQQRLGHVDRNLRALAFLLRETRQQPSTRDWLAFMASVRSRYTTETERAEFDRAADALGPLAPVGHIAP